MELEASTDFRALCAHHSRAQVRCGLGFKAAAIPVVALGTWRQMAHFWGILQANTLPGTILPCLGELGTPSRFTGNRWTQRTLK